MMLAATPGALQVDTSSAFHSFITTPNSIPYHGHAA
jgi:hypothetical protein